MQNLLEISTEVNKVMPFKKAILVKFDFGGQRPCFEKAAYLIKDNQ